VALFQPIEGFVKVILSIFLSFLSQSTAYGFGSNSTQATLDTVATVELPRYLGKWHEIKRISNRFQDDTKDGYGACKNTIAEYAERSPGKLSVQNTCTRYNAQNKELIDIAKANGRVVEGSNGAKLKVNFTGIFLLNLFGIGDGDYWILGLGPNNNEGLYSWAVVGAPTRKFAWILSRTKMLPVIEEEKIRKVLVEKGYDPESLKSFTQ